MKQEKVIELQAVSVGYMTETVIRDLSLTVRKGELVGIFGSNGAGKTTLLCAVNRLAVIPEGRVLINGAELTVFTENSIRKEIGYVPQHFEVDPRLPVLAKDVILMGRYGKMGFFNFGGEKEMTLLHSLSEMFEVRHLLKKPFGQLSGGEKKRILIARALIKEPRIMLLDEIFAWLDPSIAGKIADMVSRIHKEKSLTTLIVSHDIDIIEKMCNRVVWMKDGDIIFDGSKETFLKRFIAKNGIA